MITTKIYLIRHGEAEGNIFRRAHGWYDGKITAKGYRQIDALAERFRDVEIDALYSSDLSRAMTTAGAITKYHDLQLNTDPRLREVNLGDWEDEPWGNLSYRYPHAMAAFNDDPDEWTTPNAETFPQLKARMSEAIMDIARHHRGETVAIVSHGMAIRAYISMILGVHSADIYKVPHGDNTCVALLEVRGEHVKVKYYNDNSHLTGDLSTFSRQSWWKKPGSVDGNNLRFEPLDPNLEPELYIHMYANTWRAVHGGLRGFGPQPYLDAAKQHFKQCPQAILKAIKDDDVVGITELDTQRGAEDGIGWLSLCYVVKPERRRLLGVQLVGHAVSVYRKLGRRVVRLNVYEGNLGALAFYKECGFKVIGSTKGVLGPLMLMEKEL